LHQFIGTYSLFFPSKDSFGGIKKKKTRPFGVCTLERATRQKCRVFLLWPWVPNHVKDFAKVPEVFIGFVQNFLCVVIDTRSFGHFGNDPFYISAGHGGIEHASTSPETPA
jgi:hypothetical protein